ncbi:MAG TPA: TRAP transporter large permease [Aliidongia sp.]|uniref:TRAP transporter large permease n=1 Tax=Aliidongia sp. TaxID=1914230 RepID=UPI002DDD027D|nr:TRAP transporter large permease [Aliidongia sp.]HEV2675045.1 TRAP transporter large permease [Aliidongia sp.]
MSLVLGVLPVALLLLGFPIFLVLLTAVMAALLLFMHIPLSVLHQTLFGAVNAYTLLAVPFFIFTGELMGRGSVAQRLVNFVNAGVGRIPGGLGVTTVCSSALFGAMSGLSAASVATIGRAMLPALMKAGYPMRFSAGLLTSMGAIDVVIPPSIPLLVYGTAAQESVPRLYAAGIVPALLLTVLLCSYVVWFCWRNGIGGEKAFDFGELGRAAARGITALGAPVIIFGGIYGGVFTPTEAAAVACVYAAGVPMLIYRELGWRDIFDCAQSTAIFTGQILVIVACAVLFGWVLTVNQIPSALTEWLTGMHLPLWSMLLAINVLLLLVGSFMDGISAILLLTPLLVPLVKALGVDPVHFGIIFTVNLGIGLFHPPFGINIFVAQTVLRLPLNMIYRGIVPFVFVYLVGLAIITYVPAVSLAGVHWLIH